MKKFSNRKIKYPRLGYVTQQMIDKHKESVEKSHKYNFSGGYLGTELYKCSICGHIKKVKVRE